ncbi:Histidine kinase [Spirosomataceae bacterium TFI 002]|nr:Histidine kinase [Spirosomataceae bacterium TFI 002]
MTYSPIFGNRKNTIIYSAVWLGFAVIQANFLIWVFDIPVFVAATEAFIFNSFFGIIGRSIWPVTKFSRIDKVYYFNSIITHLVTALLIISIWYFLSSVLVKIIYNVSDNYVHYQFLNETKTFRILQGSFYYLLLIMNYYLFILAEDRKENELREVNLLSNLKQAELEMLKSQLNPHFIFNSLNSISSLTIVEPKSAQKMVILLSDFLRYSLRSSNELVTFKEELAATEKYLAIEKVRFDDKLLINKKIAPGLEEFKLPSLILQPLVENAIKYGLHDSLDASTVDINCEKENELLKITISNEFDPKSTMKKGEGVGLRNVKDRLSLIYDLDDLLLTEKKEQQFIVTLRIPRK